MREIKFRAWDSNLIEPIMYKHWDDLMHTEGLILMQFTGLKDKNGKEIYEGDIVQTKQGDTMQVRWNENYALFGFAFKTGATSDMKRDCEIIGNIYENPELLAVK